MTTKGSVPAKVLVLIDSALAVLDADRNASRNYLMRALALLQASSTHDGERQPESPEAASNFAAPVEVTHPG
jgi:hypothetical protein